jgi:gas vesicle protein
MDNKTEVIREQIEQTRSSLQDKLETLEEHVKQSVQDATDAASDTVQQVKETVQGAAEAATETVQQVKDAVQETVETVKGSFEKTVVSVQESLNISRHVEHHPCIMFFGAVGIGYVGTRLLLNATPATAHPSQVSSELAEPVRSTPGQRNGKNRHATPQKPGFWQSIAERYSDELSKLEGLAISAVASVVRESLTSAAPPAIAEQVTEIIDNFTTKLGGKPMQGSVFQTSSAATKEHEAGMGSSEQRMKTAAEYQSKPQRR